ncbi:hypothetical protein BRD56_06685 [Thermoplasmatales archaeon SW_10_69_26]|nr:MAG: hypothetical protein BRD56_06685 [Thermoplasmatales archaeon SW_10_69_26]
MLHRSSWVGLIALGAILNLAVGALGPLPSTLDTGEVLEARSAQWTDATGVQHQDVTGDDVSVYTTEGVNQHPDLEACLDKGNHGYASIAGQNPSTPVGDAQSSHGTLTAGVLCGDGTLSRGSDLQQPVTGVAPGMRLFSFGGICVDSDCAPWFEHHDIRIVSHSMTGDPTVKAEDRGASPDADILFVMSAGNGGGDGSSAETIFPYDEERVMGVANGYADGSDIFKLSSRGAKDDPSTWPHITAPGCTYTPGLHPEATVSDHGPLRALLNVPPVGSESGECANIDLIPALAHRAHGYHLASGTSMAAPYVSGVAAMMFEVHPGLTALEAKHLLTRTAEPFLPVPGNAEPSPEEFHEEHGYKAGYGLVNATGAVAAAHYMALEPGADASEAVDAYHVGYALDGALVLNPNAG